MRQFADDPPIEERVADQLVDRGDVLAIAESATGGLVSSLVTDVPGSSEFFDRGIIAYANGAKLQELGVTRESLDEMGAVSAGVAEEMALGIRDTAGAEWGLATTGIAGPTGGSAETPIGTVFVGVAHAAPWGSGDSFSTVNRYGFEGDRRACKERFARTALSALVETVSSVSD